MARATLFAVSAAVLLLATSAAASRDLLQTPSGSAAGPPSATFGGPRPTIDASVTPPAGNSVRLNWRGVGTQNFSSGSDSQYGAAGAVADLFLQNGTFVGKHLFVSNSAGGISPVFTRQDAQGNTIGQVVGRALANVTAPATNDNGGYGSLPFLLLEVTSATGFFQGITYIQRINTLGGIVPGNPRLYTLPSFQGKPNALLAVPYQADYLFFQSGGAPGSAPATTGSAPASG